MYVCGWGVEECGDDTNLLHLQSLFLKNRKQVHISHHYKLSTTTGIVRISLYWVDRVGVEDQL